MSTASVVYPHTATACLDCGDRQGCLLSQPRGDEPCEHWCWRTWAAVMAPPAEPLEPLEPEVDQ